MKHFYTLIITICFTGSAYAQTNSYFNNNPCWRIKYETQIATNCFQAKLYNYFINGDTMIGPYQYKKVYEKGQNYLQCYCPTAPPPGNPCLSPPPVTYYGPGLAFFIRSSGKKMYLRLSGPSSPDTLLYDFNLNIGDTLPTTFNINSAMSIKKVTFIDSVNTFNGWMKRFYLDGSISNYILEGMGYVHGLIEPIPIMVCSCSWGLQCYSQNTTAYYPSSGPSFCLLSVGMKETEQTEKLTIYPNPSAGIYRLQIQELFKDLKVEIYNSIGQLVYSSIPQKENIEIDLRKEKDGIYFLNYISNGETRSVKLIKE